MNITLDGTIDNDATITFTGPRDRDNAWLTVNLGPDRPSASVCIIAAEEGLRINVYPLGREADDNPAIETYVFDAELSSEWATAEEADECIWCHAPLRDTGVAIIDNTGGDVCGVPLDSGAEHKHCNDFAPDALGEDRDVCSTCLCHKYDHPGWDI
jgi:hypothetical protein